MAALSALWFCFERLTTEGPAWDVQIFIDSNVALRTLLRGYSRQRDWNMLVAELWFQTASVSAKLGAWRVPSKQNLADAPTRPNDKVQEMQQLAAAGFKQVAWQWPRMWMKV